MQMAGVMPRGLLLPAQAAGASRGKTFGRHAGLSSQVAITPGSCALAAGGMARRSVATAAGVSCSAEVGFALDQIHQLQHLASHLPVAYERIAAACSVQNCGDVVYRSTLDKAARGEDGGTLTPLGASLILSAVAYLIFPTPGVLQGWYDTYIKTKTYRNRDWEQDDFKLNKKIGTGAFGTVWLAEVRNPSADDVDEQGQPLPVVVKKASEYGLAEAYMNERVSRCFPETCAEYLGALDGDGEEEVWLVWRYEGDATLADLVKDKTFPMNAEAALGLPKPKKASPAERRAAVLRAVMSQLFTNLEKIHSTGLVHRDIKPQNTIVTREGGIKLIDLGAMADLRVGRNYQPKEFVLDPRFAAPEQFIMQTSTVVPEADWQAALLSPVVWQLERPDKFDMYSCGIMLLQFAFPALRTDKGLIAFNTELEKCGFDLNRWRRRQKKPGKDLQEGFDVLDLHGGAGWDLARRLVKEVPSERWTAKRCLGHPFVKGEPLVGSGVSAVAGRINSAADEVLFNGNTWIFDSMAKSGTEKVGGLTEAALDDLNDRDKEFRKQMGGRMAPRSKRLGTIAWWQDKQKPGAKSARKAREAAFSSNKQKGKSAPPPPPPPPPPPSKGKSFSLPNLSDIREIIRSKAE